MNKTFEEISALDFINAMTDEVVVLDEDGRIVATNPAWNNFSDENNGDSVSHYIGLSYLDICRSADGPSSAEAQMVYYGLRSVLDTGEPFRCEYPCDSPDIKRWFELSAYCLDQSASRFVVVTHRNITVRHITKSDVSDAYLHSEFLSALVATTNDAVLTYDLEGRIITWNRSAERLYGYSPDEAIGQSLELLYPEGWPKRIEQYRDEIIAGKLQDFEAIRVSKDGTERLVWISCAPIRGIHGDIVSISNIHRDITDIRRAEEARDTIAQEVIHRAKNMLSVVSAIHRQTAKSAGSLEEFNKLFGGRIMSLGTSTNLLVSGDWTTVPLKRLLESQLDPFVARETDLVVREGPNVVLDPEAVQVVGMAIHELATNSAKYGVLQREAGQIAIDWSYNGTGLSLSWKESTATNPDEREKRGFGKTVLTTMAPAMLKSEASYDLNDDGVLWQLVIPTSHISIVN